MAHDLDRHSVLVSVSRTSPAFDDDSLIVPLLDFSSLRRSIRRVLSKFLSRNTQAARDEHLTESWLEIEAEIDSFLNELGPPPGYKGSGDAS